MTPKHIRLNTKPIYLEYIKLQKYNDFEHDVYKQQHICYANMLLTSDTHPYMWKPDQWALDVIKQASQINNLCQIPSHCVLDHDTKRVSLLASS